MYPLAEKDGPWLVLATTFRGEGARDDARQLVQELRSAHRLQAYTHEKAFDYTGEQRGVGLNPDGTPKRMRYANSEQVVEVAVLVGDFASAEDPRGQKILQKVKGLRPKSVAAAAADRLESEFLQANPDHVRSAPGAKPPLHAAILIPNPLLPDDYFSRQRIDEFVMEMNADVTHGLLDCPGRYTVRVATFAGAGTFNTGAGGDEPAQQGSGLVDMGRFVEVLKGNGWKDPQRVGSIDQLNVPGPDGRPMPHPEITRIVANLGPDQALLSRGQIMPRVFGGILLDVQPRPIDVPRPPAGRR